MKHLLEGVDQGDKQTVASIIVGGMVTLIAVKFNMRVTAVILGMAVSLAVWWIFVGKAKYSAKGMKHNG